MTMKICANNDNLPSFLFFTKDSTETMPPEITVMAESDRASCHTELWWHIAVSSIYLGNQQLSMGTMKMCIEIVL